MGRTFVERVRLEEQGQPEGRAEEKTCLARCAEPLVPGRAREKPLGPTRAEEEPLVLGGAGWRPLYPVRTARDRWVAPGDRGHRLGSHRVEWEGAPLESARARGPLGSLGVPDSGPVHAG